MGMAFSLRESVQERGRCVPGDPALLSSILFTVKE
jgi:hypothetical protein